LSSYFEDLSVEDQFLSRGRTITEADLVNFAGLSGDYVELHTNEEYASRTLFGRRIAHGALIFSISVGLTTQMGLLNETILAFHGVEHLRFTRPVFIGDTVRVRKRVLKRQEMGKSRGLITFETSVVNQRDEQVVIYHDKLLVKRREQPG
jgi:acyl dehydratase